MSKPTKTTGARNPPLRVKLLTAISARVGAGKGAFMSWNTFTKVGTINAIMPMTTTVATIADDRRVDHRGFDFGAQFDFFFQKFRGAVQRFGHKPARFSGGRHAHIDGPEDSGCAARASENRFPEARHPGSFAESIRVLGFLVLLARPWSASTKDMPALMLIESWRVRTTSSLRPTFPVGHDIGVDCVGRPRSRLIQLAFARQRAGGGAVRIPEAVGDGGRDAGTALSAPSSARQDTRKSPFPLSFLAKSALLDASRTPREDSPFGVGGDIVEFGHRVPILRGCRRASSLRRRCRRSRRHRRLLHKEFVIPSSRTIGPDFFQRGFGIDDQFTQARRHLENFIETFAAFIAGLIAGFAALRVEIRSWSGVRRSGFLQLFSRSARGVRRLPGSWGTRRAPDAAR